MGLVLYCIFNAAFLALEKNFTANGLSALDPDASAGDHDRRYLTSDNVYCGEECWGRASEGASYKGSWLHLSSSKTSLLE